MKKLFSLLLLVSSIGQGNSALAQAQTYQQTWGPVSQTGPIGTARNYRIYGAVPSSYTVDWFNDGAAATTCTYQVIGSSDGKAGHWHPMTDVLDCATYNPQTSMIHIANKPVMFLQINILTYTQGDSSTAVTFNYTRGQ